MKKIGWIAVAFCIVLFLIRFTGVHIPYHQDESKWAAIVAKGSPLAGTITHPPLDELTYVAGDRVFGNDNLRFVPLLFFALDALLLFWFVKWRWNEKTALWAATLFSLSFYSVLASLMVDTDGQVLPFVFLLLLIVYFKWREAKSSNAQRLWGVAFVGVALLGLLIKFSFAIGIAALVFEYVISERSHISRKFFIRFALGCLAVGTCGAIFIFGIAPHILPGFSIFHGIAYWKSFVNFTHRNFLQTFIQCAKVCMYLSPLLVLSPFLLVGEKYTEERKALRPFFLFIAVGLFFYLIAFDFSSGALDRYLEFLILPLSIMSAVVLTQFDFAHLFSKTSLKKFALAVLMGIALFSVNFLPQAVPPLYPKTAWLRQLISLKWDFLFPFTGGSGPVGFYVSFLFIACSFVVSLVCILAVFRKSQSAKFWMFTFLVVGFVYNGVFIEEYLFGNINGSVYPLLRDAQAYIVQHPDVRSVVVYNDIGQYEINQTGKYERRLYATPQFESTYKDFFKAFSGDILYIDIPRIGDNNFYSNYMKTCTIVYSETDKYITAQILQCHE